MKFQIAKYFHEKVTLPILQTIGIDQTDKKQPDSVNDNKWEKLKSLFDNIQEELANPMVNKFKLLQLFWCLKTKTINFVLTLALQQWELNLISQGLDKDCEKIGRLAAEKIQESITGQLSKVSFYREEMSEEQRAKLGQAVLTNCGAESNFASLDNQLKRTGNSTKLSTVSQRHVIAQNKLHMSESWKGF